MRLHHVTNTHKHIFQNEAARQHLFAKAKSSDLVEKRFHVAKSKNLAMAAQIATHVYSECEDFDLWSDSRLLLQALQKLNKRHSSDGIKILSSPTGIYPHHHESLQIMKFLCLLLGFGNVEEVAQFVLEGFLQQKGLPDTSHVLEHFSFFQKELINEWKASESKS